VLHRLRRAVFRLLGVFVVGSVAAVAVYRFVDPPATPLMAIRIAERWQARRLGSYQYVPVPLAAVSADLQRAVIAAEDARFFVHHGIDFAAARSAAEHNARTRGRRIRGASTITMQCAKNVFLWPGRTWVRKALEVWFALLMEALWGKRRILEVYLNVVEWGDGIYGAEAASRAWFGRAARELGPHEAGLLAAVLPNPRRWSPTDGSPYVRARAAIIRRRAGAVRLDAP
jgi:monofunctional biosynthetic peptidoglycan transglycosylase